MTKKPRWEDPFSPEGTREATAKILTGMNYRLFYEGVTRRSLIRTYKTLTELAKKHPQDDQKWRENVKRLLTESGGNKEEQDLRRWLLGLTKKTADNLGVKPQDYPSIFDTIMADIERYPTHIKTRETALLLWCGAATLTIRGSQKSKIGKSLEKSIARAALTVIGLDESKGQFRLGIGADEEVSRETDAEIKTARGYVRMEVGLIGKGNPEVIGDKVGRIDRNGVILFDALSAQSMMWNMAQHRGVRLIQLRNNHPVEELRQHLADLRVAVQTEAIEPDEVEAMAMPLSAFRA